MSKYYRLKIQFKNSEGQDETIKAGGNTLGLVVINLIKKFEELHADWCEDGDILYGLSEIANSNEFKHEDAEFPSNNFTITKEVVEKGNDVPEPTPAQEVVTEPVITTPAPAPEIE